MDYYTIDFETANYNLTSACSLGIIGVQNKKIAFEKYYLINPEDPFSPLTTRIHNLTSDDVKDAPNFKGIWDDIKEYFNQTIVFSHNSGFDFAVLKSLFEKYNIPKPTFYFGCTVKIARMMWSNREVVNHKLNSIARHLGIELNHHHALSDARVCVAIINAALRMYQVYDVDELYHHLSLKFGLLSPENYYNTFKVSNRFKEKIIKTGNVFDNKLMIISGKPRSMKRKDLLLKVVANGGFIDTKVSNKCDYFVMLEDYDQNKLQKVKELKKQGININILTEEMILEMVK